MSIIDSGIDLLTGNPRRQAGDFLGREAANLIRNFGVDNSVEPSDSYYENFYRNLLATKNSVAIKPLWVCFLNDMPNDILKANSYDNTLYGSHEFKEQIGKQESEAQHGILFCQKCDIVGEGFEVIRPTSVETNGFMPAGISNIREHFRTFKVSYLETNDSFTDNMIRPWMISSSYKSLKYAEKIDINVFKYTKLGVGRSIKDVPIKTITYHGCVPINIETEELEYGPENFIVIKQVEFFYDTYVYKDGYDERKFKQYSENNKPGLFGRALSELTGYDTIIGNNKNEKMLANVGSDLINQGRSIIASGAQTLISNLPLFGGPGTTVEQFFGFDSRGDSGRHTPPEDDHVISSPVNDDYVPKRDDYVLSQVLQDSPARAIDFDDVVTEQVLKASKSSFTEIRPLPSDTYAGGVVNDDVIVPSNDTPIYRRGIPDDYRPNTDDVPIYRRNVPDDYRPNADDVL